MDNQYKKTLVDIILDYLQDPVKGLIPGYFQAYYYGDPLDIPTSVLPCVSVEKISTDIKAGPTGMDEIDTMVYIKLMYNKKNDFGVSPTDVLGVRALEEYAEARETDTGLYSANAVMGILRKYFTLPNEQNVGYVLDQLVGIRYGVTPRPGGELTGECQIRVKFHQLIEVPVRK